jgi:hypothetical protein
MFEFALHKPPSITSTIFDPEDIGDDPISSALMFASFYRRTVALLLTRPTLRPSVRAVPNR